MAGEMRRLRDALCVTICGNVSPVTLGALPDALPAGFLGPPEAHGGGEHAVDAYRRVLRPRGRRCAIPRFPGAILMTITLSTGLTTFSLGAAPFTSTPLARCFKLTRTQYRLIPETKASNACCHSGVG